MTKRTSQRTHKEGRCSWRTRVGSQLLPPDHPGGGSEAFGFLALGRGWQSRSASPSFPGGTKPQSQELAPTPHLSPLTSTKVNQVLGPNIPNLTSQRAARALPSSKTRPATLSQGFWGSSQK